MDQVRATIEDDGILVLTDKNHNKIRIQKDVSGQLITTGFIKKEYINSSTPFTLFVKEIKKDGEYFILVFTDDRKTIALTSRSVGIAKKFINIVGYTPQIETILSKSMDCNADGGIFRWIPKYKSGGQVELTDSVNGSSKTITIKEFGQTFKPPALLNNCMDKELYNKVGKDWEEEQKHIEDEAYFRGKGSVVVVRAYDNTVYLYSDKRGGAPTHIIPLKEFYEKWIKPFPGGNSHISEIFNKTESGDAAAVVSIQANDVRRLMAAPQFEDLAALELSLELPQDIEEEPEVEITPEFLLRQIEDPSFIADIVKTLKLLYAEKITKYTNILKYLTQDEVGQKKRTIILKLIEIAKSKIESINVQVVKTNFTDAITDEDNGLLSLTGDSRADVRNYLSRQMFILSRGFRPFTSAFNNIVLTGPAGVGKTKLAKVFSYVFSKSGILLTDTTVMTSPKDFIAEYVGQTAVKTDEQLSMGLDGVVFIDEAYGIMQCQNGELSTTTGANFGAEAITELVNFLDKYMGLSIVIVAGYKKEIKNCFLGANSGLPRRFPKTIDLKPYSEKDLTNIFVKMVVEQDPDIKISPYIGSVIYTFIKSLGADYFKNQAGDITNLVSLFYSAIYASVKYKWTNGQNDQVNILRKAFNEYKRSKLPQEE